MARKRYPISVRLDLNCSSDSIWFTTRVLHTPRNLTKPQIQLPDESHNNP
jgi:hypothetical protein